MARCYHKNDYWDGEQVWGRHYTDYRIEDSIVQYCRKAFGRQYRNLWINPIYFDDKYFNFTHRFFSEVGVELYPKITNLQEEMKRCGMKVPKPLYLCKTEEEREEVKMEWEEYSAFVWEIVHRDIDVNKEKGIKPVSVIVKGVRYPNYDGDFDEEITDVRKVSNGELYNA